MVSQSLTEAAPELGDNLAVSITLVDDESMRALNREHRGRDEVTDVLSFSQLEGGEMGALPEGMPLPVGDIVISLPRCAEQAQEYGHSFDRELGFLVCHGMMHLMGFDHATPEEEEAMMAATEEILAGIGLSRQ